ncbi:MAG: hypothetical protein Q7U14_08150 [Lacisediminimonas sp.]|nr:hypothetical protein [Lacisediminimonas sp.]
MMIQPEEPIDARARAVSYDLNKFRERRLADRRFQPRDSVDRRIIAGLAPDDDESTLPAHGKDDDQ